MSRIRFGLALAALAALALWSPASAGESFVDDSGQRIEFSRPHGRVISLYAAHTENLFSLGLDQEVIGVTRHENFPPQALAKPVFHYGDDPEKFLAAKPDLVLIRPMIFRGHRSLVDKLSQRGVTVVSLQPRTVAEMLDYWRRLGRLTGRSEAAERMIGLFQEKLARFKARADAIPREERQRVYFESIHAKMKTFAPDSMALFVLQSAGGINVAEDAESVRETNIAAYSKERILAKAAQIDVYLAQRGPMNRVDVEAIKQEPGFGAIKAVREGRVYLVEEELVSRPTMRLLDGVAQVARFLYPGRPAD